MSFFSFSGVRSPPSRIMPQPSNVSPFCTSPTQLEETLDPNGSIFPGGVQSPSRGFSVKEYEEELNKLSKENFSLKLRIYFLEERIGKITGPHDVEQTVKNNIELKVENEAFRKEIKEKLDLLCQAVKALDLVEEEHKKQEEKHAHEVSTLNGRIVALEKELASVQCAVAVDVAANDGDGDARPVKEYRDTACQFSETVVLFAERSKTEKEIARLQDKIDELENEVRDLEGSLDEERDRSARLEIEHNEFECPTCPGLRDELRTQSNSIATLTKIVDEKQSTIEQQSNICAEMESLLKTQIDKCEQMKRSTRERDETIATLRRDADELGERARESDAKVAHLEEEKRTACKAIQSFMVRTRAMSKQVKDLKAELKNKEKEVKTLLEGRSGGDATSKSRASPSRSSTTKTSLSSASATSTFSADKEHSWRGPDASGDEGGLSTVDPTAADDDGARRSTGTDERIQELLEAIQEKEDQLRRYENDITLKKAELDSKDNRIVELETEVELLKTKVVGIEGGCGAYSTDDEKQDSPEKTAEEWSKEVDVKNKEIERLEAELRKRTFNLQEIVNKELWDKNREIERLQKRLRDVAVETKEVESPTKEPSRPYIFARSGSAAPLSEFHGFRERLRSAREESGGGGGPRGRADELPPAARRTTDDFESAVVRNLRAELADRQRESEKLVRERRDVLDVCDMLRTRLEELALFLDSLLSHEAVTDLLGKDRRRMIKSAIDKSLDLSRTLSMSITLNPNQSLLELSSLSELLNASGQGLGNFSALTLPEEDEVPRGRHVAHFSIVPTDATLTYDSYLRVRRNDSISHGVGSSPRDVIAEQARTIDGLRSELDAAKREITARQAETDRLESMVERDLCDADDGSRARTSGAGGAQSERAPASKSMNSSLAAVHDERSESEAWSEPDRNVSLARIGLADDVSRASQSANGSTANRSRSSKYDRDADRSSESTGDEQKTSKSPPKRHSEERASSSKRNLFGGGSTRRGVSALQEQVQTLSVQLKERDDEIANMQRSILQLENKLKEERTRLTRQFEELKAQKNEAERFVRRAEERVSTAETKKLETERQFVELEAMVTDLVKQREACGVDAANNVKNAMKKIESLEKQRDDAIEEARVAKESAERALVNVRIVEMKYEALEDSYRTIEHEVKIKYDAEMQERVKEFECSWASRFEELTNDLVSKQKQLDETRDELKTVAESESSSRRALDERTGQLEKACAEIAGLKGCVEESRGAVAALKSRETELEARLRDVESANRQVVEQLRHELDRSKRDADSEREALLVEKARLEHDVATLERTCRDVCAARDEAEHKTGPSDGRQRAELELRISELESQNADLHNRLVKLQSVRQRQQNFWSRSVQTSPQKTLDVGTSPLANRRLAPRTSSATYASTGGDPRSSFGHGHRVGDVSGYTSEEFPVGGYEANVAVESPVDEITLPIWYERSNRSAADEDRERTVNSSPDLGIESDQGRFSSLETNVSVPTVRPLLQPIEITHSVHSMLEAATAANAKDDKSLDVYDNERQRWKQLDPQRLHEENVELKRRLLRMKRALENTVDQLNRANEQKKRMEREVRDEVLKTSLVLRKARANLDSGSETEIMKAA